jgi:flagellar hook-associated protein 2
MDGISSVFHVGGLVSGLKTDDIITQLVALDSKPINDAKSRQQDIANSQVAWKQISAQLVGLKTSADQLALPGTFTRSTASASDPDAIGVTTGSDALPGSINVSVKQLALRHQVLSQGFDSATSTVDRGTIQLSIGAGTYDPIVIDDGNDTLQGVADAINAQASGVQASVVNDGSASGGWHLMLTSRTTGEANKIAVSGDLGSKFTFTTMQAAQDAKVVIGGSGGTPMTVTSSTNTISDAVPGLSLQLLKPEDDVTINVARDTPAIRDRINNFIASYNTIATYFSQNMYYDASTKKAGILEGDTSAVLLQDELVRAVTGSTGDGIYRNLASLGITLTADGQLTVSDASALDRALSDHPDDVAALFSDTTSGLGKKVSSFVDDTQDVRTGLVGIQLAALDDAYSSLDDVIAREQQMVDDKEAIYRQQFMDMETALASLQSQGSAALNLLASGSTTSTSSSASTTSSSTSSTSSTGA